MTSGVAANNERNVLFRVAGRRLDWSLAAEASKAFLGSHGDGSGPTPYQTTSWIK